MQQPNVLFIDLIYGSYRKEKKNHWSFLTILKQISALCATEKKMAHKYKEIKCRTAVTGPKASRSEQIISPWEVLRKFLYDEKKKRKN